MAAPMPNLNCGHFGQNGICIVCLNVMYKQNKVLENSLAVERKNYLAIQERVYNSEENAKFLRKWVSLPSETYDNGDVTLFCTKDGSSVTAHSFVLASRSDVFRAMLQQVDMKEKETKRVEIHEGGGESVKAFLKFLYTAQLSDEELHSNYRELVKLAHFYQVQLLLDTLDDFISEHAVRHNAFIETLKLAYLYDLDETKKAAHVFLALDDPNHELYDMALSELEVHHPWMAPKFSSDVVSYLKSLEA